MKQKQITGKKQEKEIRKKEKKRVERKDVKMTRYCVYLKEKNEGRKEVEGRRVLSEGLGIGKEGRRGDKRIKRRKKVQKGR